MVYNPRIISQLLSTQVGYINRSYGQMFYYTDLNQIWYDTQDNNRVQATDIVILQFERQRNNFVPSRARDFATEPGFQSTSTLLLDYSVVYVIETNCLYLFQRNTWQTIYGVYGSTVVGQTYLPNGMIKNVVADDVSTNGILNDGSVVVRDNNRMICGLLRSDGYTFDIQSLIGGCINLDPSGVSSGDGCLQLNSNPGSDSQGDANLNANLVVFGNISTVSPAEWDKQYRLVTENIKITSNTTIKAGSLLKSGSILGADNYTEDTVLTADITATSGMIVQLSKLYINSVINNMLLQPPFLFDIDEASQNKLPSNVAIAEDDVSLTNNELKININSPFKNNGDCCYIPTARITGLSSSSITNVVFNDAEYIISYVSTSGISDTARICYYSINNTVKVLP